jgi:segregation and condensation protein A
MSYEVKLEIFEGPLDLLLHLINRNELTITDIPIALITQQYLETIELMKSLNLEVAGEYLVMAAYLTHIKSQMLLPLSEENQEDGEPGKIPGMNWSRISWNTSVIKKFPKISPP